MLLLVTGACLLALAKSIYHSIVYLPTNHKNVIEYFCFFSTLQGRPKQDLQREMRKAYGSYVESIITPISE